MVLLKLYNGDQTGLNDPSLSGLNAGRSGSETRTQKPYVYWIIKVNDHTTPMKKLILIPIFLRGCDERFRAIGYHSASDGISGICHRCRYGVYGHCRSNNCGVNLYDSAAGGNEVWSDTWDTVHVFRGYYTVTLDLSIAAGHWQGANSGFTKQYWLDASVKGNHLTPKVQLTSCGL